ncbi:MAG: JAB domain-containing protein [Bacteroidia bacterium]|nr:JAB domain-containing protein [Bacteroidia bacterium]
MHVGLSREQKIKVLNSQRVYEVMQRILLRENDIRRNQEHFWVVGLNNTNKILFVELVSLGASNRVSVAPPEVFRMAIYKLSNKVILVHNHPSGDTRISGADKTFTAQMIGAGRIVKIEVLDHLVITESTFVSFADEGVMEDLQHHEKAVLAEREKGLLREMIKEAEKKRETAVIEKFSDSLKKLGVDEETIKRAAGRTGWPAAS